MLYLTSFCSAILAQNFGKDTHFNGLYRRLQCCSLNLAPIGTNYPFLF